jgi:hypothetical protein
MFLRRLARFTLISMLGMFALRAQATPESEFWQWFKLNEATLFDFERNQEETFDRLAAAMQKVDPRLTFEFGPKVNGQREFVISADGAREAFPKVESLFASAPKLPKWKVIKFRPRREPFDIEYKGVRVQASSVKVLLRPQGERVAIEVLIPSYTGEAREAYLGVAFLMLDQALGEYDVEMRVGRIDVAAAVNDVSGAVNLEQLPHAFDSFFAKHL